MDITEYLDKTYSLQIKVDHILEQCTSKLRNKENAEICKATMLSGGVQYLESLVLFDQSHISAFYYS